MEKIFCVEDDDSIRELTVYALNTVQFEAKGFESGKQFFEALRKEKCDLILLDIMLPDMDGYEILRTLKTNPQTKDIFVIMLTAKAERMDKIKGLDSGADDYVTKPFDILELTSRIKAVLRRGKTKDTAGEVIKIRNLEIDYSKRKVYVLNREISLTYKEFELLYLLAKNKGKIFSRDKIMSIVWATDFEGETRTVDVHIRTLRKKLEECADYVKTIRNVGYTVE